MRLADQPRLEMLYKYNVINIIIEKTEIKAVQQFLSDLGTLDLSKDYEIEIRPKRKKRSLDANRYFWELVGKLGATLNKPDSQIYRELVRDNGVFQIVSIREDAIDRWVSVWGSKGIGWVCDDLGECRVHPGYHNIKCYYGSSTYTTKEMSRLIDAIIWECKQQGIETATPDEIERMKKLWGTE